MSVKEKKERPGWKWQECKSGGGYWVKDDVENAHKHKIPSFCPHCKKFCGDIDHKYLEEYRICRECYTMNIEDRQLPLFDPYKYKNK